MRHSIRALLFAFFALAATALVPARAQTSSSGQPKTPFAVSDFGKLRWLEGTWEATSPGENTVYQRYHFANDSTLDIAYFSDPDLAHETGSGKVYLSVGRIYHTFGPGRWGASHVDNNGVYFVPQVNARNTFQWTAQSPDAWTSTMRTGASGRERVSVYQMKRLKQH
jgi:hypothetical protein